MWRVKCNTAQINQVIQNLIINARQAMPEGGTINVICDNIRQPNTTRMEAGDYLRIAIQDHGTGISDTILPKIFDPYFSTKKFSADNGKGLGLAIVYSIISKHKGHIEVESRKGQGTTFTIFLPANNFDKCQHDEKHASLPSKAGKSKVLVMDDEELVRRVMKTLLEALGHETIMAEDGPQAIKLYRESQSHAHPVDLVIMDLTIPGGMGGKEIATQLLQLDPQAKLIVYSGDSNNPIMTNFKDHGFKAAVTKPFILDTLELVINSSLA
jgi:CheY-like chemotaxis protein